MADIEVVDALARLQLVARRNGRRMRLRAPDDLADLIRLCGLGEALGLEPQGQPEEREERLRVEEEREAGDRTV